MGASSRTPAEFRDTVLSAFADAWVAAGESLDDLAWDNLSFETDNKDSYVYVSLAPAAGEVASLGTGNQVQMRRSSNFVANVNVRHNKGMALADTLAEKVIDFLESAKLTGIRFRNQGLVQTGRFGEWFQVNVTAEIDYDSFRTV